MNRATPATGWVRNPDGSQGYTWNPITGCLNHVNGMCKGGNSPCYAYRLAHGRLKNLYLANNNLPCSDKSDWSDPFYPRFCPEKLEELERRNFFIDQSDGRVKRHGIFPCNMSDLFGIGIPEEWTNRVLEAIRRNGGHDRFYLLTKQPQNLAKFSPFPDNCDVGVTVTNKVTLDSLYHLAHVKASKRFVSFEPLLESVNLDMHTVSIPWAGGRDKGGRDYSPLIDHLDWLIIGAQTKPTVYPKIEWVEKIVRAADKSGIPVFLKDNLKPLLETAQLTYQHTLYWRDGYYTSPDHPNVDLQLRQEMPKHGSQWPDTVEI